VLTKLLNDDQEFDLYHGDCIPHQLEAMPPRSVDFSVFSPPFPALYAYTSEASDIGNSEDIRTEAKLHLGYFYRGLARVLKPGRVAIVHVMQIPRLKRSGGRGLNDFRGLNIRLGERAGLTYEYDWCVTKNPQSQAIRTKSRELQFSGLESDRAKSRGALTDYLIKFVAPGDNETPVCGEGGPTRNDWIEWAEGCWPWQDIRETDTLNVRGTKTDGDTKHICPLQLGVIERAITLYSNPGEIVFSPFAGVGSEGHEAVRLGRRFYGCELRPDWCEQARRNIQQAIEKRNAANARPLFDLSTMEPATAVGSESASDPEVDLATL
jgi:hypothetical protein